jgi:hypothetical protein
LEEQYQELLRQAEYIDEFGEDEDGFNFDHGGREGMENLIHCPYNTVFKLGSWLRLGQCP